MVPVFIVALCGLSYSIPGSIRLLGFRKKYSDLSLLIAALRVSQEKINTYFVLALILTVRFGVFILLGCLRSLLGET